MSLDVMLYYELDGNEVDVYRANITHNLNTMAQEAFIYSHLWRPEEIGVSKAAQLIEPLEVGLRLLKENPDHYRQFDAANRWGIYDDFVSFVENYLNACKKYPSSIIHVSR